MRVRRSSKPWSNDWSGLPNTKQLAAHFSLSFTSRSNLRAKVLIFANAKALRTFWSKTLKRPLMRTNCGVVNALHSIRGETVYYDPKYYCVIGLTQSHLTMDVITHECVHAALCWIRRRRKNPFLKYGDVDEEELAYAVGRLADGINWFLYKFDLYKKRKTPHSPLRCRPSHQSATGNTLHRKAGGPSRTQRRKSRE